MIFYLYLLQRSGGYFASIFTISAGFYLSESMKSIPSISGVSLTFSGVFLIFG